MDFTALINRGKAAVTGGGEASQARAKIPPSVAQKSKEELQVMVVDLAKKLKERNKQIETLSAASKGADGNGPSVLELQEHLQEAQQQLFTYSSKIEELQSQQETWAAADKKLQEAAEKESMFQQQLTSLKEALKGMAEERETAFTRLGEEREKVGDLQEALSEKALLAQKHADRIIHLEAELATSAESAAQAHQKLLDTEAQLLHVKADNERLVSELDVAKRDADDSHAQVTELKKRVQSAEPSSDASQRVAELEAQLASSTARYEGVKIKLDEVSKQLLETQERLTVAESATASSQVANADKDSADAVKSADAGVRPEVVEQLEAKVAALAAELARSRLVADSSEPEHAAELKDAITGDQEAAQAVLSPISAERAAQQESGSVVGDESRVDNSSKSEAEWSQLQTAKERIKALETQLFTQVNSSQELEKARVRIATLESDLAVEKCGTQKLDQLAKQMNQMASALQLGSASGAGSNRPRLVRGNSVRLRVEKLEQQFEVVKEKFQKRTRDKPGPPLPAASPSLPPVPSTRSPAPASTTATLRPASTAPLLDPLSESPRTDAPSTPKPQGERSYASDTDNFPAASHQDASADDGQPAVRDPLRFSNTGGADSNNPTYRALFHDDSDDVADGHDGQDDQTSQHPLDVGGFRGASMDGTGFSRSSLDESAFRSSLGEDDNQGGDEMSEEGGLEYTRSGRISIADMSQAEVDEELSKLSQRVTDLENTNESLMMLCDQSSSELQSKLQLLSTKDGRIQELEASIMELRLQLAGAENVRLGAVHSSQSDEVECLALPYPPPRSVHTAFSGGDMGSFTHQEREPSVDGTDPIVPSIPIRSLSQSSGFTTPRGPSATSHHCSPSPGRRAPDTPSAERLSRLTSQLESTICERDSLQLQLAELSAESERQARLLEAAERECHMAVATVGTLQGRMEELERHWEATQEDKSHLQSTLESEQGARLKLGKELQEIVAAKSKVEAELTEAGEELQEMVAAKSKLEAELTEAANKTATLQADLSSAESAKTQLQGEVAALHTAKAEMTTQLDTVQAENSDLQGRLKSLNESIDQLEATLAEERAEIDRVKSEFIEQQELAQKVQSEMREQIEKLKSGGTEQQELAEKLQSQLREQVDQLKLESTEQKELIAKLQSELREGAEQANKLQVDLAKHREVAEKLEVELASLSSEHSKTQHELQGVKDQYAVKADEHLVVVEKHREVEELLEAAKAGNLDLQAQLEQQRMLAGQLDTVLQEKAQLQAALMESGGMSEQQQLLFQETNHKLQAALTELDSEREKLAEAAKDLEATRAKNTRLQDEVTETAASLTEANSRLDAELASKQAIQDRLEQMVQTVRELEGGESAWSGQITKLNDELGAALTEKEELQTRVLQLCERVREFEEGESRWSEQLLKLNGENETLGKRNEELEEQLRSLKETGSSQSERVQELLQELEAVRSEKKQLEDLTQSEIARQEAENKAHLEEKMSQLEALTAEVAQLQVERGTLMEKITHLQGLAEEVAQLQLERGTLVEKITHLEGLTAAGADLQKENSILMEKITQLEALAEDAAQLQTHHVLLQEKTTQAEGLNAQIAQLQAEKTTMQDRVAELEQHVAEVEELRNEHAGLTQQVTEASTLADELRQQLATAEQEKAVAVEHAASLEREVVSERAALAALQAAKVAAESSVSEKQHELEELTEKLRETEEKLEKAEARLKQQLESAPNGADSQVAGDERVRALEEETVALRQEISENKKKFVQVAKKKQGEYTAKIAKLEHEVAQLQPQVQEVVQLREQLERLSLELAESSAKSLADIDEKAAQVSGLLAAVSQKEFQCNSLGSKLEAEVARAASLSSQLQELQQALTREEDKARQADLHCESLRMELKKCEEALQAATRELASIDRGAAVKVEQLSGTVESMEQQLEAAKNEAATAKEELAAKEADRQKALRALDGVKKRLDRVVKEKTAAEEKLAELRGKSEEAQASCMEATQQLLVANRDRTKLEMEMKEYRSRAQMLLKAKERELQSVKQAPEPGESSNVDLEEAHARILELQGMLDSTASTLEALRQHHAEELFDMQCKLAAETARLTESLEFTEASLKQIKADCDEMRLKNETLEARLQRQGHASNSALLTSSIQAAEESKRELQAAQLTITSLQQQLEEQEANLASYRSTTDSMMEAKDGEVLLLLRKNALLQEELNTLKRRGIHAGGTGGVEAASSEQQAMNIQKQASHSERPPLSPHKGSFNAPHSPAPGLSPLPRSIPASPLNDPGTAMEAGLRGHRQASASELLDGIINATNPPTATTHSNLDEDGEVMSDISPTRLSASDEKAFMTLAAKQAERDDAVAVLIARNKELEGEVEDLLKEVQLREEMEAALKEEIREWERSVKRQDTSNKPIDMEYLKNTVVKLLETGQAEPLLPVLSTLLSLSPSEIERCKEAVSKAPADGMHGQGSSTASVVEQSASIVSSLSDWTTWALGGSAAGTTPTVRRS